MMPKKSTISQAKYDAKNCKNFHFKLVFKTDGDIIDKLASVPSMQGYIKQLIREDLARTGSVHTQSAPKKMSLDDIYSFLQNQADSQPDEYDGIYDLLNALTGKLMGYTPEK